MVARPSVELSFIQISPFVCPSVSQYEIDLCRANPKQKVVKFHLVEIFPRCVVKLAFHDADTDTDTDTDILADFRARILARMSVSDARVYTCTVHDKLSCTRLQNYTIGAS